MAKNSSNSYGISMVLGGTSPPKTDSFSIFPTFSMKTQNLVFLCKITELSCFLRFLLESASSGAADPPKPSVIPKEY